MAYADVAELGSITYDKQEFYSHSTATPFKRYYPPLQRCLLQKM